MGGYYYDPDNPPYRYYLNTGGKYIPSTDSWMSTSLSNAPSGRYDHTAVWTGTEMIVWGGYDGSTFLNTGGRYDPSTDSWVAVKVTTAPSGRCLHTAIWDDVDGKMIIWGGLNDSGALSDGGIYIP